jgi:phage protein D
VTRAVGVLQPVIKVDGSEMALADVNNLNYMRVEREVGNPGRALLRFNDRGYKLASSTKFALGTGVTVSVQGTKGNTGDLIDGVITGVSVEQTVGRVPELTLTVDDRAVLMGYGNRTLAQTNVTDSKLCEQIATRSSLRAEATGLTTVHPYFLQNGSDRALLDAIAARTGRVWWVAGKVLNIKAPSAATSGPTLTLSKDLDEFSVRGTGLRPTDVKVSGWDAKQSTEVVGEPKPATSTLTATFAGRFTRGKAQTLNGQATRLEATLAPENQTDAEAIAGSLAQEWDAASVTARGSCPIRADIAPMKKVTIKDAGPLSGSYVVTRVEHILRPDGFRTTFVAGPLRPLGLADVVAGRPSDPLTLSGMYTAQVSDIEDPDGLGRVKVKYLAVGATVESNWARVVTVGGGASRGITFHPEVGDEVLVGFERGDNRHPVVIGGLFSQKAAFPTAKGTLLKNAKTNVRTITSREGHVIELSDDPADTSSGISLTHKNGHKLRLGGDGFTLAMSQNKPVSITTGQASIKIDEQGNITIKGMKVSITADTDVEAKGSVNLKLEGGAQTSLKGSMTEVKGDVNLNLQAGAMAALKGAMVNIN